MLCVKQACYFGLFPKPFSVTKKPSKYKLKKKKKITILLSRKVVSF